MPFTETKKQAGTFAGSAAGTYPNFAVYEVTGDTSYSQSPPETFDVSPDLDTVTYVSHAVAESGGVFYHLVVTSFSDSSAIEVSVYTDRWVEVAATTNLAGWTWLVTLWGEKVVA